MSRYFLSSLLIIIVIAGRAQDQNSTDQGIRLSIDLSPVILLAFDPERVGIGASLDYEFKPNIFAVVEGGWLDYHPDHQSYSYQISGFYTLVGADYNVLKNENRIKNDILFIGLRYGASSFNQKVDNITISNYWGNYVGNFENEQLFGQWAEITGGIKAELYFAKNVFVGWTLRAKILISGKDNEVLEPYIIPGYGKTEKNFRFGLSWFIAYRIPFKK